MFDSLFPIVFLVGIFVGFVYFFFVFQPRYVKKDEEEKARQKKEEAKKRAPQDRLDKAYDVFAVHVKPPYESQAYDEIVRIVNLLALLTAQACVAQDKFVRSEKVDITYLNNTSYWDDEVSSRKQEWSKKRKLALQICPELADRLPHFSEFEPLKSYREEHLQEKANKKVAA